MVLSRFGSPTDLAAFGLKNCHPPFRTIDPIDPWGSGEMLGVTRAEMRIYVRRSAAS
jgi:hypothetical protein